MACSRCKLPYPPELTTDMHVVVNGQRGYIHVCGICALDVKNNIHGTHDTEFNGEQAEMMRQDAIDWRHRHPNAVPLK